MEEKKGFIGEFKEFIMRGNVMDMAVGIIVGAAFKAIVDSLVTDIITPFIGLIFNAEALTKVSFHVGPAEIMIGNFINTIISFVLTALVLFCVVKAFNKARSAAEKKKEEEVVEEEAPAEPEPTKEELLLAEIRDLLKKD